LPVDAPHSAQSIGPTGDAGEKYEHSGGRKRQSGEMPFANSPFAKWFHTY
jgi:hypothetical protein